MSERPTAQELTEAILEFLDREILPTLIRQSRDAAYFVRRPLPAAS